MVDDGSEDWIAVPGLYYVDSQMLDWLFGSLYLLVNHTVLISTKIRLKRWIISAFERLPV